MSKLIVIDPGHGGSDPGAVANGLHEKELTLKIGRRVRKALLRDFDVTVALTREQDATVSLDARTDFANARRADYFVSVHINSGGGEGYEDYIHKTQTDSSPAAARRNAVHTAVAGFMTRSGAADRGKKKANFHVLRESTMPAVLTENLFIDSPVDAALLRGDDFLADLAEAHARGIARALALPRLGTGPSDGANGGGGAPVGVYAPLLAEPRASRAQVEKRLLARPHGEYSEADVRRIVGLYFETAQRAGLDPLLAVSQMILETGNLTSFWSQRPRRNMAGIGVTGEPGVGISFATLDEAVRAHVGRLLAYAIEPGSETPAQRALVDEALDVRPLPGALRGSAPRLSGLVGHWAVDPDYAKKISRIANEIRAQVV
jgi:N-acetylmuramoyl-L-alanine amidase